MNVKYAFIITFIAGISTILGFFIVFLKKNYKIIPYSLSFTSGIMVGITILDLIPNSLNKIMSCFTFIPSLMFLIIFILIGLIIDLIIENSINEDNYLYKVGILSMLAIVIHNIPEGIITFFASTISIKMGIKLAVAIALHNIPEGILISIPIYYSSSSKVKAFIFTFISAISELIGALIAFLFIKNLSSEYILGYIYALISGLMLYIAIYKIPQTLSNYKEKGRVVYFIIGLLIMIINNLILD